MMKQQRRITQAYFDFARYQYAPLIQKLAFEIGTDMVQIEELKVQGIQELLKCMICYSRGGSFMTFFYGRLINIFRHMRNAEYKVKRIQIIPLDSMLNIAGQDCNIDYRMMVEEFLEYLSNNERNVITELFFNKRTMREISDDLGVAPSTICHIKARAIDRMQRKCEMV